jgi:hypothetical protein
MLYGSLRVYCCDNQPKQKECKRRCVEKSDNRQNVHKSGVVRQPDNQTIAKQRTKMVSCSRQTNKAQCDVGVAYATIRHAPPGHTVYPEP